jgi:hypothetical protein
MAANGVKLRGYFTMVGFVQRLLITHVQVAGGSMLHCGTSSSSLSFAINAASRLELISYNHISNISHVLLTQDNSHQ